MAKRIAGQGRGIARPIRTSKGNLAQPREVESGVEDRGSSDSLAEDS